jgi:hypothetical protein
MFCLVMLHGGSGDFASAAGGSYLPLSQGEV